MSIPNCGSAGTPGDGYRSNGAACCSACPQPAVALIAAPYEHGAVSLFAIVRPVTSPVQVGEPVCALHLFDRVTTMLMKAREAA